ncbi:LTA synthase family protein [Lacticaseibacillus nasuensis]|uniref:LTA synthase family protein n=1 Tax=Lacticaseibacillus nasuensis TaxID=944671 RepID=UPI0022453634|nr:alkaline phosphatase family protein [Lacticaseibacillus nasuensis]MCX2456185.1 sulfatase-like hydrolase/transferase [Lacticaseibacillus nasuensis]
MRRFKFNTILSAGIVGALMVLMALYSVSFGYLGFLSTGRLDTNNLGQWFTFGAAKYFLLLCQAILVVFIVNLLNKSTVTTKGVFKSWVSFVFVAVILSALALTLYSGVGGRRIYDAVFLISRNAHPMFTGILIYFLVQKYVLRFFQHPGADLIFGLLLIAPIVFNRDIFFVGNGFTLTGILLLCISSNMFQSTKRESLVRWTLLFIVIGLISMLVMGELSSNIRHNLLTLMRFVGLLSPLTVFPAVMLTRLSEYKVHAVSQPVRGVFTYSAFTLIALTNVLAYRATIKYQLRSHGIYPSFVSWKWLIVEILLLVIISVIVGASSYYLVSKIFSDRGVDQSVGGLTPMQFVDKILTNLRHYVFALWKHCWRIVLTVVTSFILQLAITFSLHQSFLMEKSMVSPHMSIFLFTLVYRLPTMLFSSLIIVSVFLILLGLTNRYWTALISTSVIFVIFAVATHLKVVARDEPIMPADLLELKSAQSLMEMVNPILIVFAIVGILIIVLLLILIERRSYSFYHRWWKRVLSALLPLFFILGFHYSGHPNTPMYTLLKNFGNVVSYSNQILTAQKNGPLLQFVNNLDIVVMAKPVGYSKAEVYKVVRKYDAIASQINHSRTNNLNDQTFVFNLSESFADPTRLPGVSLNQDPIPYIRNLKKRTTSGLMMSYGYGGGTANMEFESLTGWALGNFDVRLSSPYSQLVEYMKSAPSILNGFSQSVGIHPYVATFYNRISVYKKFGFDKFSYLGSKYKIVDQKRIGSSPYLSDSTAYKNVLYRMRQSDKGQFINLVSIQNHYPYDKAEYPVYRFKASGTTVAGGDSNVLLQHYSQGLSYTDQAVKEFKEKIDKIDRPITWVFYGDHLPGAMYDSIMTAKNTVKMHQTDYFIYSNRYAREHGALKKLNGTKIVGTDQFIALAMKQANVKVNSFTALLTKVQEKLPVTWIKDSDSLESPTVGTRFVTQSGKLVSYGKLTVEQKTLIHDYQIIQYDITAGKQYSQKLGMHP